MNERTNHLQLSTNDGYMDKNENVVTPYSLIITHCDNGYILTDYEGKQWVIEDSDTDPLASGEHFLWDIMNHFDFAGSRHDKERLRVVREKGDKYEE